jgi:hypothetical protein
MSTESSGGELESRTTEGVTSRVRMGTVGRGGREWGSSWTGVGGWTWRVEWRMKGVQGGRGKRERGGVDEEASSTAKGRGGG